MLTEQFNKNIYTRILFTNVTAFVIALIALILFSSFMVKQVTYDQVEQELLRKAKRVNFALLQQTDYVWGKTTDEKTSDQAQAKQDFLKYLADIFDAKITIFDKEGTILDTSAEQEVVPGSKVEVKYAESFTKGETVSTRTIERETGQLIFIAVCPWEQQKYIENGILWKRNHQCGSCLKQDDFYRLSGNDHLVIMIIIRFIWRCTFPADFPFGYTVAEISKGGVCFKPDDQPLDEINILAGLLNTEDRLRRSRPKA
jgi:hypothetical protein